VVLMGAPFGIAIAMPLVAAVMAYHGWRTTFYATGLLPVPVLWLWWRTRTPPKPAGASQSGVPAVADDHPHRLTDVDGSVFVATLTSSVRDVRVLSLCVSYFFNSTVLAMVLYGTFPYIDKVWGKGTVSSGFAACLPFLVAMIMMSATGYVADQIGSRLGNLRAHRTVAVSCLVASGLSLVVIPSSPNILVAVGGLCFLAGAQFSTEGQYWSTASDLSRGRVGAV
jgi:ACS family D-galactonate transporter-like MFS transporter